MPPVWKFTAPWPAVGASLEAVSLGDWFAALGRWSLPVYLLHVPVYRVLTRAWFGRQFDDLQVVGSDLGVGLPILVLSTALSLGLSAALWRMPRARRIVSPRS